MILTSISLEEKPWVVLTLTLSHTSIKGEVNLTSSLFSWVIVSGTSWSGTKVSSCTGTTWTKVSSSSRSNKACVSSNRLVIDGWWLIGVWLWEDCSETFF